MIQATYRSLVPQQRADRLQLKLQELSVFQNNLGTVNTTAALIGGFAFSGVTSNPFQGHIVLKVLYFVLDVMCIASCFHSVLVSTAAGVMGPDTAMRGGDPDASVGRALEGVLQVRKHVYVPFGVGIALFEAIAAMWTVNEMGFNSLELAIGSGLCIAIFLGSLLMVVHTHRKMRRLFSKQDVYARQTGLAPTLH
eukprot:TRINITY_DN4342_c0_g1_i2.p1 TRINITY_DN4342_c0_g1~~TRINITY_DN4342_c0_g1_i2.p1  ORF type:complete len:219 (+),score=55.08 TRINITY_DN4342_c0_g1_i2:74-658(+)